MAAHAETGGTEDGPLRGIRVLEFSQIVAGPVAGVQLSDLGADVIKVEPPRGDDRRNSGAVVPNEGKFFQSLNRGKRSLVVDLSCEEGRAVIHRLVPGVDIVFSNYRPGVTRRLGIDYETLRAIRPDVICVTLSGFGDEGPHARRAGSDIAMQAYSGMIASEGKVAPDGAPEWLKVTPFIDRASGFAAAMAICAALFERARTGRGQEIRLSLLQTALELMSNRVMREPVHDATSRDPEVRMLREAREAGASFGELVTLRGETVNTTAHRLYYRGYNTARGALIFGALTRENRRVLREILDMHDDTDSPDFDAATPEADAQVERWRAEIQEKLMARPAEEWEAILVARGVPASTVQLAEEMSDDEQVQAMGIMQPLVHAVTGPQEVVGPVARMSVTPLRAQRAAPALGEHSVEILREAGFADAEVDALVQAGVVVAR